MDDDTFQKMVDRQYDIIKRPRPIDDSSSAKNIARSDENDVHGPTEHPTPSAVTEAVMSADSEVEFFILFPAFSKNTHRH